LRRMKNCGFKTIPRRRQPVRSPQPIGKDFPNIL